MLYREEKERDMLLSLLWSMQSRLIAKKETLTNKYSFQHVVNLKRHLHIKVEKYDEEQYDFNKKYIKELEKDIKELNQAVKDFNRQLSRLNTILNVGLK